MTEGATDETKGVSDYVKVLQQIDAEYVSGWQALHGFAEGTTKHQFIDARFKNVGAHIDELRPTIGDDTALDILISWHNGIIGDKQQVQGNAAMRSQKRYYTIAEVQAELNISSVILYRKITLRNIEIRHLPGSNDEYLTDRDVEELRRSITPKPTTGGEYESL